MSVLTTRVTKDTGHLRTLMGSCDVSSLNLPCLTAGRPLLSNITTRLRNCLSCLPSLISPIRDCKAMLILQDKIYRKEGRQVKQSSLGAQLRLLRAEQCIGWRPQVSTGPGVVWEEISVYWHFQHLTEAREDYIKYLSIDSVYKWTYNTITIPLTNI